MVARSKREKKSKSKRKKKKRMESKQAYEQILQNYLLLRAIQHHHRHASLLFSPSPAKSKPKNVKESVKAKTKERKTADAQPSLSSLSSPFCLCLPSFPSVLIHDLLALFTQREKGQLFRLLRSTEQVKKSRSIFCFLFTSTILSPVFPSFFFLLSFCNQRKLIKIKRWTIYSSPT